MPLGLVTYQSVLKYRENVKAQKYLFKISSYMKVNLISGISVN